MVMGSVSAELTLGRVVGGHKVYWGIAGSHHLRNLAFFLRFFERGTSCATDILVQ